MMLYEELNREIMTLSSGTARCDVIPSLGGSIGAWSVDGQPLLRRATSARVTAGDPFGMGSFPLVPYSNRIANGTFEWAGRRITLARNFVPEPHSIHGVGFESAWEVRSRASDGVVLALAHRPGAGWPWPFTAEQVITLRNDRLTIEMRAVNGAEQPVPLAFGVHPYFPREGASLEFQAQGVWLVGDDGLPSLLVKPFDKFDYSRSMAVSRGDIDHCFTGWNRMASIVWQDKPLGVEVSASASLPNAVVCIRSDDDGFCFEPVPHANDALNRPGESPMPIVQPGDSFSASVVFRATRNG
jgi:aldose 1-epimerase